MLPPPKNDTASQKIEAASPKAPEVNKPRPVEAINGRSNGSSQPNIEHGSSTVVKSPRNTVNVTNQRNQNSHPETVVSSAQLELSGTVWCSRFPGLKSLDSLDALFKAKVDAFFSALKEAGITSGDIKIGATYRPLERSYLMYNAFFIAKGRISPDKVERFNGVNIDWVHRGTDGKMDLEESKKAAREMCGGYGLNLNSAKQTVGKPGSSRHNYRAAIDMTIHNYSKKKVKDANGDEIELKSFADLVKVGRSYGVRYFPAENMHWSDTGH